MKSRLIKIITPLGEDVLLGTRLTVDDGIFDSFILNLEMISTDKTICASQLLHQIIVIEIKVDDRHSRFFHGIVSQFEKGGQDGHFFHYYAKLHPQFWFLNLTKQYRIFQNQTVPTIIKDMLHDVGIVDLQFNLKANYEKKEYCCQYGESTYTFLHRLMEEEGIFYFYEHEKTGHKLVFIDDVYGLPVMKNGSYSGEFSHEYHKESFQPGKFILTDYHYQKAGNVLQVEEGKSANIYAMHHHPGQFSSVEEGKKKAERYRIMQEAQGMRLGCETDNIFFAPGKRFQQVKKDYYVLHVKYYIQDGSYYSRGAQTHQATFTYLPLEKGYYPQKKTGKPQVKGVETAFVVGSENGNEICTNQQGQIKVQFHWGQLTQTQKMNSCWLRVAQPWAGNAYGMQFLPRVGQEVIVQFIHGDPDKPIVTGSLYNSDQALPFKKTRSGIKTRSISKEALTSGNELSFEDTKDEEEIFIYAKKNFNRTVENSEICEIKKGNFQLKVDQGEIIINAHKKISLNVNGNKIEINTSGITIETKKLVIKK